MRLITIILLLMTVLTATAFRIVRPPQISLPLDRDQVNQLNNFTEDVWNLQNGEFNFDISTTVKTNADNGDMWFIITGGTVRLQFKANNHVWTISPDGV